MQTQNVPDRLVGDLVAEMGQGASDAVVSPAKILTRHSHNQRLHPRVNPRPPRIGATFRAIGLLRHHFPEPAEDRLGLRDQGYFRQSLPPQPLADLSQRGPFFIREPQPSWRMRPENPVLGGEILDLKHQFLIDQSSHVGQQACPLVVLHPIWIFSGR